jgi:penicillin amidase
MAAPTATPSSTPHRFFSSSRPRRHRKLLAGLLLLVLLACIAAWLGTLWQLRCMRAALPQLHGRIVLAGLTAPVTVRRDAHGVPHIAAQNLDDLWRAQGYITAQDRLWQMDMLRRYAAGNLAELLGPPLIEHDRAQRILQILPAAAAATAALSARDQRFLADYAAGVNAYIAACAAGRDAHWPAEFALLHYRPQPWTPVDSLLIGMNMQQMLATDFPTNLAREILAAKLPPQMLADLYPVGSWRDHPPISTQPDISAPQQVEEIPLDASQIGARATPDDLLHLERLLHLPAGGPCPGCTPGSNNWAVSGAHTTTGLPLLSNDMHLDHSIPDTWYEAQLTAGAFNVAGLTLPGLPFVIVGHNAHIAWGFTDLYADVQDVYVEQTRGDNYRTPTGWQPFTHARSVIHVRGGRDVVLDLRSTLHGPVITPLLHHEHRTLTLRWTVYDPAAVTVPFYDVDSAGDWQQFRAAFALFGGPPQNAVYADTAGHIGYQAVGKVPWRPNGLCATPIADFQHEWQGYIPFDAMPSDYDPPGGILATANARVTPDDTPYPLTLNWAAPYRNERIWKVLTSTPKLSAADLLALQNDVHSELDLVLAQRLAYAIDHAQHPSPRLRQAADLLRTWDGDVTLNASAATIVDAARKTLWPMLLTPHLGRDWKLYTWGESSYVEEQIVSQQPARWLAPGYANWNDFLAAAVARALHAAHAPHDLAHWRYGVAHPVEVEHPLYGGIPWLRALTGTGVLPQSGDDSTVKQVHRSFGPSERLTVDLSSLDRSTLNLVIGQSGDPLSPHYKDHWPYWYAGTTFALPFSDAAVTAAAADTLVLTPQP